MESTTENSNFRIPDEEITKVFNEYKSQETDKMSMTDLDNALKCLGIDLTPDELEDKYNIDDDPDTLTEEEFKLFISDRIGELNCKERCEQCFRVFDPENTGFLSMEVMRRILTQNGKNCFEDEEVDNLLRELDLNGDGKFDIEEITKFLYKEVEENLYEPATEN